MFVTDSFVRQLTAAGIGRGLYAKSGSDQIIHANLFLLASAISGEGKSEGCRPLVRPFIEENLNRIISRYDFDLWGTRTKTSGTLGQLV